MGDEYNVCKYAHCTLYIAQCTPHIPKLKLNILYTYLWPNNKYNCENDITSGFKKINSLLSFYRESCWTLVSWMYPHSLISAIRYYSLSRSRLVKSTKFTDELIDSLLLRWIVVDQNRSPPINHNIIQSMILLGV